MSSISGVALNGADPDEASAASPSGDSPRLLLKVWILTLPISSVLLVPSIQGTTPSNLLALACLLPLLHARFVHSTKPEFYRRLAWLLFALGLSIALSQLALLLSTVSPGDVLRVPLASLQPGHYLRTSLITQSMYMATSFIVLSFFWTYYVPSWDRWLFAGAIGLACYGFFEVAWSAATGMSGCADPAAG